MPKGMINAYECKLCGWLTVTVDRDEGVTPMMFSCEATGCSAFAVSKFYKVPQDLVPTWEWYCPKYSEYIKLDRVLREHVDDGGLMYRKIERS